MGIGKEMDTIVTAGLYRKAARSFACPTCDAEVGQACIGANGRERISVHQARGDLAHPRNTYNGEWASQASIVDAVEGYVVYGIYDRQRRQFGYVGQTGNLPNRMVTHLRDAYRGRKLRVSQWLRGILSNGGNVEFRMLEPCTDEEHSLEMEMKWVGILARRGHRLANRWDIHQEIINAARQ